MKRFRLGIFLSKFFRFIHSFIHFFLILSGFEGGDNYRNIYLYILRNNFIQDDGAPSGSER